MKTKRQSGSKLAALHTLRAIVTLLMFVGAWPVFGQSSSSYAWTNFVGQPGTSGTNDGMGSAARFSYPAGVAVDSAGNVFVADTENATIRKVTPAAVVTTLAGSAGVTGTNDGTGSAARFWRPKCVAVDGAGDVFVAEYANHTIRKVTPAGVVTTLAGSVTETGSADGLGSAARFYTTYGLAANKAGTVFVADFFNCTIRRVTAVGEVTTLAGKARVGGSEDGAGSDARFGFPAGVAVDGAGNVFVADQNNHTIRKVTAAGVVTTLAGSAEHEGSADGTGSAARFSHPGGVAVDRTGTVFVADYGNHTIRKVTPAGVVTSIGGAAGVAGKADGIGSGAGFSSPTGIAVDKAGNLYVADNNNKRISKGTPVNP